MEIINHNKKILCLGDSPPTTAIVEAIATLTEAERRFKLERAEAEDFFPEWRIGLPALTATDKTLLAQLRQRYIYQRSGSHWLEATVMWLFVSPLLSIAGFFAPPFKVRSEPSVQLVLNDGEEVLQGRIDVLVYQEERGWIVVIESQKTVLSVWTALPQTLAYLMANPHPESPSFGMITNGDEIVFVKVIPGERRRYDVSRVFAPFVSLGELYSAVQILQSIGQAINPNIP